MNKNIESWGSDSNRDPVVRSRDVGENAVEESHKERSSGNNPQIICLCGSTQFYEQFMEASYLETMAGRIVLSPGVFLHRPDVRRGQIVQITSAQKVALDELHKRKIDLADEVYILNVGGYIGDSTRSEIKYAQSLGKPIRYLEPDSAGS